MNGAWIEYMITGSIASSLQGEPRATHDLDVVVAIPEEVVPRLIAALPAADFHLDELAIREAIAVEGMFNLIELREGDKVDFWMLTRDPFDLYASSEDTRKKCSGFV